MCRGSASDIIDSDDIPDADGQAAPVQKTSVPFGGVCRNLRSAYFHRASQRLQGRAGEDAALHRGEPQALPYVVLPERWVTKWIKQAKYGLVYTTSNGAVGLHFNDGTKIIEVSEHGFEYISRLSEGCERCSAYSFENCPAELTKKVKLLRHYKTEFEDPESTMAEHSCMPSSPQEAQAKIAMESALENALDSVLACEETQCIAVSARFGMTGVFLGTVDIPIADFVWQLQDALKPLVAGACGSTDNQEPDWALRILFRGKALQPHSTLRAVGITDAAEVTVLKVPTEEGQPFYVKHSCKKDGAILFALGTEAGASASIAQAVFPDGMVLLLSTNSKVVTRVNKEGDMSSYLLSQAGRSGSELASRLQLVRDMYGSRR